MREGFSPNSAPTTNIFASPALPNIINLREKTLGIRYTRKGGYE